MSATRVMKNVGDWQCEKNRKTKIAFPVGFSHLFAFPRAKLQEFQVRENFGVEPRELRKEEEERSTVYKGARLN